MNLVTRLALTALGRVGPRPPTGAARDRVRLPRPDRTGGLPLMQALAQRHSTREFRDDALPLPVLGQLLWAADGVNRPRSRSRTAPSAMNAQEIDLYVALPQGLYRYDPPTHALELMQALDVRGLTGVQDFVEVAPVELMMVATPARLPLVPAASRIPYAAACAGAIAQNVYLACTSLGLACVVRGWFDERRLARALKLARGQRILLAQTVGLPAAR